jgi:endonuclease G
MKIIKNLLLISTLIAFSSAAFASRGGLDKNGCHTDKKSGKHHCHEKSKKSKKSKK